MFYIFSSLTASKEAGASIEIDGKKVALGVPGAQRPVTTQAPEQYSFIPLRRGGTPEDAAASVLLYVSHVITCATDFQYIYPQLGFTSCFICVWAYAGSYWWCRYLRKKSVVVVFYMYSK